MVSSMGLVGVAVMAMLVAQGCARAPIRQNETVIPSSEQLRRNPAASAFKIFDEADLQLFQDLFQFNTHGKQLKYVVRSKLWTSMDKHYLKEKVQQALQQAIAKTLAMDGAAGGLLGKLKKNLTEEFLKEFVYTLQVFKIFNGTIQFDLYFIPDQDSPDDYSNEYSSNRLVRLQETGSLRTQLNEEESWTMTGQLGKASQKLIELNRSSGSQPRQLYAGGAVSVYLKLLDMRWNPFKPIPNPKKNALKGFIRYRRYFIHDGQLAPASCKTDRVSIEKIEWSSGKQQVDQLLTVDLYKSFNLAAMAPTAETLEIFPGRWLATNQGRRGLLPSGFLGFKNHEWVGKSLKTGYVYVSGKASVMGAPSVFDQRLNSLVYSFGKKRFDAGLSSLSGDVVPDAPNATQDVTYGLLQDCQDYFTKALSLGRVTTSIHANSGGEQ